MSERVVSLDLVRGAAAFLVAVPHFLVARGIAPAASEAVAVFAVEVFFVLSGFVLAPQLAYCLDFGRFAVCVRFWSRRWLRILPPYLIALVLFAVAFSGFDFGTIAVYALFLQNLFAQAVAPDYFAISWSLAVEEWFYITFPLVLLVAARVGRPGLTWIALGYLGVFAAARTVFADFSDWGDDVRRVVVFRLDSIALGVLLHQVLRARPSIPLALRGGLFGLALVCCIALGWWLLGDAPIFARHLFFPTAGLLGASTILLALGLEPMLRRARWSANAAVFLGRISYSTYLFHLLVLQAAASWLSGMPTPLAIAVYLALVVTVTGFLYLLVERPILAHRPALVPPARLPRSKELIGEGSQV